MTSRPKSWSTEQPVDWMTSQPVTMMTHWPLWEGGRHSMEELPSGSQCTLTTNLPWPASLLRSLPSIAPIAGQAKGPHPYMNQGTGPLLKYNELHILKVYDLTYFWHVYTYKTIIIIKIINIFITNQCILLHFF